MKITSEKDFIDILLNMGIERESVVLVQADLSKYSYIVNQEQALIDALKKVVTEKGCIIVPTFTLNCLDPSSYELKDIDYEEWEKIRVCHKGFDSNLTRLTVYTNFAEQFLKNEGVKRTEHPIYSFAFWGKYDNQCLEQPMHLPISFCGVLKEFIGRKSYNVMINEKIENSLLFPALAKTMSLGVLTEKKAIIKSGKRAKIKNFLNLTIDQETIEHCMGLCKIVKDESQNIQILSLDTSEDNS